MRIIPILFALALVIGPAFAEVDAPDEEVAEPAPDDEGANDLIDSKGTVSALAKLRLHPGRDGLNPAEAARNRPPEEVPIRARTR